MNKINKIVILCISVAALLSVGNLFGASLMKQLIDMPTLNSIVKLAFIWALSALFIAGKNYILQRYYLKENKIYMGTLFKTIFSFPFSFLESKLYNDDLNKIKGKITQEQAFISSIENITSAVFGILGLYILLFRQVSFFILLLLSVFLLFVILLSSIVNGKLSTLMYDYWQNYIKNTRKYNYISDVLSGKDYIEEKKCFLISHFF